MKAIIEAVLNVIHIGFYLSWFIDLKCFNVQGKTCLKFLVSQRRGIGQKFTLENTLDTALNLKFLFILLWKLPRNEFNNLTTN